MIESFQIGGFTLHTYGLIIGAAVVTGVWLLEIQLKRAELSKKTIACLWKLIPIILIGALLGARLWHLISDWQFYATQPLQALYIWHGGLSIMGALIGGAVTLCLIKKSKYWCHHISILQITDALAFVLPISQAMGRVGNWVNQELYGLPTQLPWKIFIDPTNRLAGYEHIAYYHPLFAYEALLFAVFAAGLWTLQSAHKNQGQLKIGTGVPTLLYLAYFGVIRFLLEFIRLEKPGLSWQNISINQLMALIVFVISSILLVRFFKKHPS